MHKVISVFCFASIAASLMAAPTANEDFVIAEDAKTLTNAVNAAKLYTDAAIVAAGAVTPGIATNISGRVASNVVTRAYVEALGVSAGLTTNDVKDIVADKRSKGDRVFHEVITEWVPGSVFWQDTANVYYDSVTYTGGIWCCVMRYGPGSGRFVEMLGVENHNPDATALVFPNGTPTSAVRRSYDDELALKSDVVAVSNALNSTKLDRSGGIVSGELQVYGNLSAHGDYLVMKDTVLSAGRSGVIGTVEEINEAVIDKASASDVQNLQSQVTTIGAHLNAEDARFVSTNYDSVAHMPEAYVEIKLPDNSWSRIWSEMTRWNWLTGTYLPFNFYTKTVIDGKLDEKADRSWGFYDSTTGSFAPDGYTWISSPKIAIAANLAYQRTVTAEGAIWVLESNGTVTEMGGMTNGFFRISDDEGNSLFEIVKGNKRTVGADASSSRIVAAFTPTKLQIGYSVVSDNHPLIWVCNDLNAHDWKSEDSEECIANVSWSGSSGEWVAQVQGKTAHDKLFVTATYEVGGETYIRNEAPVSMQHIMLGGVKYAVGTATISGHTVLTLTVAP